MATEKLTNRAHDLFQLIHGCADLTIDQIARIVQALLAAGYRRPDGP